MIKTLVVGSAGRMGRSIISCLDDTPGIELNGATEISGSSYLGMDAGELAGVGAKSVSITDNLNMAYSSCDVAIDFTAPECTLETLKSAVKLGKSLVIGTTGFHTEQKKEIEQAARNIRIVLAPNMSVGVNMLFKMSAIIGKTLGDSFDVEIIESHHKYKKDAPSGTAVRLSEILADSLGRNLEDVGVYGRKGFSNGREPKEIGIHTVRAGDIVGEHRVIFGGIGETLEIFHRAQNRETFARGSVVAAQWIIKQSPGLYDMQDVLGLRDGS